MNDAQNIAAALVREGIIRVNTTDLFAWASGISSPIYCDMREVISFPRIRTMIVQALAADLPEIDVIAGTATAGIPWGAWLAAELDLPMLYVRSKPKAHGRGNQIEGRVTAGQRVLLIEDTISTGGSARKAKTALETAGLTVTQTRCILRWGGVDVQGLDPLVSLLGWAAVRGALIAEATCTTTEITQLDDFFEQNLGVRA